MSWKWEPTPESVAQLLPQRTKGEYGKDGAFLDDGSTTPTLTQVEGLCKRAATEVASKLRLKADEEICGGGPVELAEGTATLRAAMLVELTFFANQLHTDGSPYEKLKELYDDNIKDLESAYEDQCVNAPGLGGEEKPRGSFPSGTNWGRVRW